MHAVLVDHQQRLVWSEVSDPVAKADEILIEVRAAGPNRADLMQRAGDYPPPPGWPEWMGLEAAALPEAFATSYLNLCLEGDMKAGDVVLIQAGASGLGIAAIQLAKTLGATVITTVGTKEKAHVVRGIGADVVVNRRTDDLGTIMDKYPVNIGKVILTVGAERTDQPVGIAGMATTEGRTV